jgi:hypothetical protein
MKKYILVFLTVLSGITFAQKSYNIGFSVGYGGEPTKAVIKMDQLVEKSKYKLIRQELFTHDNATKCLAVIICEILEEKGRVKLTKLEKHEITLAYKSEGKIKFYKGCDYSKVTTIKDLLNEKYINQKHSTREYNINFREQARKRYIDKIKDSKI